MKLLITDKPIHHDYVISGSVINGIDLSVFPAGAIFRGNDSTNAAGIYNVELIDGELYVTLGQHGLPYECEPVNGSHDWFGTGEWINAGDFDPEYCYIVATAAPDDAEYVKRAEGWTVNVPVVEQEEPDANVETIAEVQE
ncbi:hypothetical protein [Vreelandella titanicae]|uniref:hypothetical protein n=1 Tax=Vreelandella titanicae TaxID=664683 RepID=UPI003FD7F3CD